MVCAGAPGITLSQTFSSSWAAVLPPRKVPSSIGEYLQTTLAHPHPHRWGELSWSELTCFNCGASICGPILGSVPV